MDEYEDPLARTRGDQLALRAAALREYEPLEDEERREAGRGLQVVHAFVPLREDGTTGFSPREVWCAVGSAATGTSVSAPKKDDDSVHAFHGGF
jgi:hypothetical protein